MRRSFSGETGNETVSEDTLVDGEKKAVAVAEVELADGEGAPAEDELELDAAFVLVFLFLFFSSTCLPTNRAATFSPNAAPCAIRSCWSNAVAAAVLFQSNSTAIAACRADGVSMLGTDT